MLEPNNLSATINAPTPRASLVLTAGELGSRSNIWMGGAHSHRGDEIRHEALGGAWLIDTAGDMPTEHRAAALRMIACVFVDSEGVPSPFWRIEHTVAAAVNAARGESGPVPTDIYIVCQHGMNRSGLVTGLLLQQFGLGAGEAIDRIRLHRPGALSNQTFERLLRYGVQ
ncbi:MAG: protein-tyrosine phosphatase family protein [Anaerolineaceae bacterium]